MRRTRIQPDHIFKSWISLTKNLLTSFWFNLSAFITSVCRIKYFLAFGAVFDVF